MIATQIKRVELKIEQRNTYIVWEKNVILSQRKMILNCSKYYTCIIDNYVSSN